MTSLLGYSAMPWMKQIRFTINTLFIGLFLITPVRAQEVNDLALDELLQKDLEDILSMEITVASKKTESQDQAPAVVSTVSREEIELYGDRNLHQVLQRQPSVYTRGSYFYPNNLASFRGDMPTHVDSHTLILFNGRPLRESAWGGFHYPMYMAFPLESLGCIEIIRGPGSVMYGTNAFTGVVNLKSCPIPEESQWSVSGQGGSYGVYASSLSGGGRKGQLGYSATVQASGQQGYNYALTDAQGVYGSQHDGFDSVSTAGRMEYGNLSLDLFYTHLETVNFGALPRWTNMGHDIRVNRLFWNLGYQHALDDRNRLEFNLTHNLQNKVLPQYPNSSEDNTVYSSDILGEVTFFSSPIDPLNVTLGYAFEDQQKCADNSWSSLDDYHYQPQNAYAEADYHLSEKIKLVGGAQWNEAGNNVSDIVSRAAILITPNHNWGIKLLRGEAFREPAALETMTDAAPSIMGNPNLEPETITTYDAQVFYHKAKTYAALTFFDSTIKDLIIRDTSASPTSFKNGGEQRYQGVELEAKHFLNQHWHIQGSVTHQNNKQTSDLNYSTAPDEMAKLGSGYAWDWGSAALFATYYSKPPRLVTEVIQNPEPDALVLISANLRIDPYLWTNLDKGRLQMELKLENLLDEDIYVPEFNSGGNPNSLPDGPGFTIYGSLTWNF